MSLNVFHKWSGSDSKVKRDYFIIKVSYLPLEPTADEFEASDNFRIFTLTLHMYFKKFPWLPNYMLTIQAFITAYTKSYRYKNLWTLKMLFFFKWLLSTTEWLYFGYVYPDLFQLFFAVSWMLKNALWKIFPLFWYFTSIHAGTAADRLKTEEMELENNNYSQI